MKLGFICINIPGHLNRMTALARHLQARNHDVVFLYSSGAACQPFVPANKKLLAQTESILKSLPAIVQANGIDAQQSWVYWQ